MTTGLDQNEKDAMLPYHAQVAVRRRFPRPPSAILSGRAAGCRKRVSIGESRPDNSFVVVW